MKKQERCNAPLRLCVYVCVLQGSAKKEIIIIIIMNDTCNAKSTVGCDLFFFFLGCVPCLCDDAVPRLLQRLLLLLFPTMNDLMPSFSCTSLHFFLFIFLFAFVCVSVYVCVCCFMQ